MGSCFSICIQIICSYPRAATAGITTCVSVVRTLAIPFVCFFDFLRKIFGFTWEVLYDAWRALFTVMMQFSSSFRAIAGLCGSVYTTVNSIVLVHVPTKMTPLIPVIHYVKKVLYIVYLTIDLIGRLFPQLVLWVLFCIFWYAIGYPLIMSAEDNPAYMSDTINLFVMAFSALFNFVASGYNAIVMVVNPLLPLTWQFTTQMYHVASLLITFVLNLLGLQNELNIGSNFNPFVVISESITAVGGRIASGESLTRDATAINPFSGTFSGVSPNEGSSGRLLGTFETEPPDFNTGANSILFAHARVLASTFVQQVNNQNIQSFIFNPVFTKPAGNGLFVGGSFYTNIAETILVIIFSFIEFAFSVWYMVMELFVALASVIGKFFVILIGLFPKMECASENIGCAFQEIGAGFINDVIDAIGIEALTGPVDIQGCNAGDLASVRCGCSAKEGGLFESMPACEAPQISCRTVQAPGSGETLYGEFVEGNDYPTTQSKLPEIGCPRTFKTTSGEATGRRLGAISGPRVASSCVESCVMKHGNEIGWKFRVCGTSKVYLGACMVGEENRKKIEIVNNSPDITKKHVQHFKKLVPRAHATIKDHLGNKIADEEDQKGEEESVPMSVLVNRAIHDELKEGGTECATWLAEHDIKEDFSITNFVFSNLMYSSSCIMSRIMKTERGKKKHHDSHIGTRGHPVQFSAWNPMQDIIHGRKLGEDEKEKPIEPKERAPTIFDAYRVPLETLVDNAADGSKTFLEQLDEFHDSLIVAHVAYIDGQKLGFRSIVGFHKGVFTTLARNVTSAIAVHMRSTEDARRRLKLEEEQEGPRRDLVAVEQTTGPVLVNPCGYQGYMCPEWTCVPRKEAKTCPPCSKYTAGCTIRTLAHYFVVGFEVIDVSHLLANFFECWNDITLNREKNPARAFAMGTMRIIGIDAANPDNIPDNVRFCFPMIPPLPVASYFTWSWTKFVMQSCGITDVNQSTSACICPQYYKGSVTASSTAQWIIGIPLSIHARMFNTYKAMQYIYTRGVPGFLNQLWIQFVRFFFCQPTECPELAYAFDAEFASGGLSTDSNVFCIMMHMGSISFTYLFFFYPLLFLFLHARPLIWEISTLAIEPIVYLVFNWYNFLHYINAKYVVIPYPPKKESKKDDVETAWSNQTHPVQEEKEEELLTIAGTMARARHPQRKSQES